MTKPVTIHQALKQIAEDNVVSLDAARKEKEFRSRIAANSDISASMARAMFILLNSNLQGILNAGVGHLSRVDPDAYEALFPYEADIDEEISPQNWRSESGRDGDTIHVYEVLTVGNVVIKVAGNLVVDVNRGS